MDGLWPRVEGIASRRWFGLAALVFTVVFVAWMGVQGKALVTQEAPLRIVSLELAWRAAPAELIIKSWQRCGEARRPRCDEIAISQVWIDFPFILSYASLLVFLGAAGAKRVRETKPHTAEAARWAALAGLLAGLLDMLENVGLLVMLHGRIDDPIALATSLAAAVKFLLILLSLAVSLYAHTVAR